MGRGAPCLGHLPGQQRVGIVDAQQLVVAAVHPQVDDPNVRLTTRCGDLGGAERLSSSQDQGYAESYE